MKRPVIALTLSLTLTGAASAQLTVWTTQDQPERVTVQEQLGADFEAATGVSVEFVPVGESSLAERVTAFGAGDLPDVIYHPVSQTIGWAEAGILDTLTASDIVASLGEDTFNEGALNLVRLEEDYAAVPSDGWTLLVVYCQDLFDEAGLAAPTSFEAIQAAVEALHNPPELYGFVAATDPSDDYMMQVLEEFFLANGVTLLDDEGNVDLDNEPVVETLNAALEKALSEQAVIDRFADLGTVRFQAGRRGPGEAGAQLRNEVEKWGALIRDAGLKPQ